MTPPVRGWRRGLVGSVLAATGMASGALAGFAGGVAWVVAGLASPSRGMAVAVVAAAVVADVAAARWGIPRPLGVGRQVPRVWSRLFSPLTVAVLYGARLGVGPLTMLPTWLWWAAFVLGAGQGPWTAALAGGTFGLVRGLTTLAAAEWVRAAAPARMARLRTWEPRVAALCVPLAVGAAFLT